MTIYHAFVILYSTYGMEIESVKVYAMFSLDTTAMEKDVVTEYLMQKLVFGFVTALLDGAFFIMLYLTFKDKFESKNISFNTYMSVLMGFELIIWIISAYSLYFRIVLWFLSVNSMTILPPYIIMKKIPLTNYIFMTGAAFNLIYFVLYPFHIPTIIINLLFMKA